MTKGCAAVSWGEGRIDLFWVDSDSSLAHRAFEDGVWSDAESLGGTLTSAPTATAWAVDHLQVFAIFPTARSGIATGTARAGTTGRRSAVS